MVIACLVHSWGFISLNSSAEIPELTTSWCLIPQTAGTNALVNHGRYPLRAAMNWSRSSLRTPAAYYIISRQLSTSIRLYLHPIMYYFLFLLLPVLWTIFNRLSRVIIPVAAFAVSQWPKWCLQFRWVIAGGILDEVPVVLLDSVPISPCRGVCRAMICYCGSEEMMII